jgi:hypothetical protein
VTFDATSAASAGERPHRRLGKCLMPISDIMSSSLAALCHLTIVTAQQ